MPSLVESPVGRAAVLEKFNEPYTIKSVPRPNEPEGHDILVRVLAASYCHTDAVFAAGLMFQTLPRIGSHEFAGEIISFGPSVSPNLKLEVGTKVGIPGRAYHPCSTCYECKNNDGDAEGYGVYCTSAKNNGITRDGGFQDYCLVDSRQVVPIPSGMTPLEVAPLMCAGLTIWAALMREEVKDAKTVAIIGAGGGLGHLGVQFAAKLGKKVVAVDMGESSMKMLEYVLNNLGDVRSQVLTADVKAESAEDLLKRISKEMGENEAGPGVDAVILLPEVQPALDYGMALLKTHGTMVVVSFPDKGFQISAKDLVFRDIRVVGSLVGRNHQLRAMLNFAAEHNVRAKIKAFPLQELNNLVEEYHKQEGGKLVVDLTVI